MTPLFLNCVFLYFEIKTLKSKSNLSQNELKSPSREIGQKFQNKFETKLFYNNRKQALPDKTKIMLYKYLCVGPKYRKLWTASGPVKQDMVFNFMEKQGRQKKTH